MWPTYNDDMQIDWRGDFIIYQIIESTTHILNLSFSKVLWIELSSFYYLFTSYPQRNSFFFHCSHYLKLITENNFRFELIIA